MEHVMRMVWLIALPVIETYLRWERIMEEDDGI